jgi:hypothetical protein
MEGKDWLIMLIMVIMVIILAMRIHIGTCNCVQLLLLTKLMMQVMMMMIMMMILLGNNTCIQQGWLKCDNAITHQTEY